MLTAVSASEALTWMQAALEQAQAARAAGEVPVGAVVVRGGRIIGSGHNAPIGTHDPSAHAEIIALRAAAQHLGNYRLDDCQLFVTLEPCIMCAGAIVHARIKRLVFGAPDPKTGAAGSISNVFAMGQFNHHTQVQGGVLQDACAQLLQDFFRQQRVRQQLQAQQGAALCDYALRTPQTRFAALPELAAPAFYINDLPSLNGLRLHYVDSHPGKVGAARLCLHGIQEWSHMWRSRLATAVQTGGRTVCIDLIGFGKSDKPKRADFHRLAWHAQVVLELLQRLNVPAVHLLVAESMLPLAHQLQVQAPYVVLDLEVASGDAPSDQVLRAPFPDSGHQAALRAFSGLHI